MQEISKIILVGVKIKKIHKTFPLAFGNTRKTQRGLERENPRKQERKNNSTIRCNNASFSYVLCISTNKELTVENTSRSYTM